MVNKWLTPGLNFLGAPNMKVYLLSDSAEKAARYIAYDCAGR